MFKFAQLTALALTAVFAVAVKSQTSPSCTRNYSVRLGDYCDLISAQQNVSTYQLATVNAGIINADCSNLFLREVLCLGLEGQDCDQVSVVQEGDSCWAIATAASITVDTLLDNNPNVATDCSNIYPGEVLCVAPASTSN
ncbi:hypothetical protein BDQ17DRAFT_1359634 [Cyathus striatus]|nr:hypothetical protein BDQ17DRAFT_1359634 [Cyathus striatus]